MRTRQPALIPLLLLAIVAGVGYRDGAFTSRAARLEAQAPPSVTTVALPNSDGSFKFAVLGDFGTGGKAQYQLAEQMAALHGRFKYDTVVLSGDNLIGSERPQDFKDKFETPYKPSSMPQSRSMQR